MTPHYEGGVTAESVRGVVTEPPRNVAENASEPGAKAPGSLLISYEFSSEGDQETTPWTEPTTSMAPSALYSRMRIDA